MWEPRESLDVTTAGKFGPVTSLGYCLTWRTDTWGECQHWFISLTGANILLRPGTARSVTDVVNSTAAPCHSSSLSPRTWLGVTELLPGGLQILSCVMIQNTLTTGTSCWKPLTSGFTEVWSQDYLTIQMNSRRTLLSLKTATTIIMIIKKRRRDPVGKDSPTTSHCVRCVKSTTEIAPGGQPVTDAHHILQWLHDKLAAWCMNVWYYSYYGIKRMNECWEIK